MKILIVLTSHDQLGVTGKKTGFWLEEFVDAAVRHEFAKQGRLVEEHHKAAIAYSQASRALTRNRSICSAS